VADEIVAERHLAFGLWRLAGADADGSGRAATFSWRRRLVLAGGSAQFGEALAHLFEMMALVPGQNVEEGANRDFLAIGFAAAGERFRGEAAKQGHIGAAEVLQFLGKVL